jgi:cytochrome c6
MRFKLIAAVVSIGMVSGVASAHAQAAAATYGSKCAMCHSADGSGSTPAGKSMGAVSFKSAELIKASDSDLIAATTKGKGKMPAFAGKLTAPQITGLVAYIRTLQK